MPTEATETGDQEATQAAIPAGGPPGQQPGGNSDSEDSQDSETHGPYCVGDHFIGFEFQVPWDEAPPGTTWAPGRSQGEYQLVPLHQGGNFYPPR